uniref:Uncharacterized protein n=1 Tax=Mastocarpus papillatus TaxID=31436 RepID=A0A342RZ78_9FLOR|nr:hypothetical protein [Mastocarpus papillatus]AOL58024.1 hypothetical protein [Mastocarpus papillatus]
MEKNFTYPVKPVKIDLFYKSLNTFDFIDNNFLSFHYYQLSSLNLNNTSLQIRTDSSSKINSLIVNTTLEILTQHRPSTQILNKSLNFTVTLRNRELLSFLDFCLLSFFLNKTPQQLVFTHDKVGQNFYIFLPSKFSKKLDTLSAFQYPIRVLNYLDKDKKLNLLPIV